MFFCPGQVDWLVRALSCTQKCCRFDPPWGHIPRLKFDPWEGCIQKQPINVSLSLSPPSPSCLSKINTHILRWVFKKLFLKMYSTDRHGSMGWVSSCKGKGRGFNSQLGHVPACGPRTRGVGTWEAADECFSGTSMFLSLSSSLPLSLKMNFKNIYEK